MNRYRLQNHAPVLDIILYLSVTVDTKLYGRSSGERTGSFEHTSILDSFTSWKSNEFNYMSAGMSGEHFNDYIYRYVKQISPFVYLLQEIWRCVKKPSSTHTTYTHQTIYGRPFIFSQLLYINAQTALTFRHASSFLRSRIHPCPVNDWMNSFIKRNASGIVQQPQTFSFTFHFFHLLSPVLVRFFFSFFPWPLSSVS